MECHFLRVYPVSSSLFTDFVTGDAVVPATPKFRGKVSSAGNDAVRSGALPLPLACNVTPSVHMLCCDDRDGRTSGMCDAKPVDLDSPSLRSRVVVLVWVMSVSGPLVWFWSG
jgi:hypothetical protein